MNFRTTVDIAPFSKKLEYRDSLMLIGSCFTENMGQRFINAKFNALINPCGIVYNPSSVGQVIRFLLQQKQFTANELLQNNGLWVSLMHHGSFSSMDKNECLSHINQQLKIASIHLRQCHTLIITLGTSWIYRWKETGEIVANCHKFPSNKFERSALSIEEIVNEYDTLITEIQHQVPNLQIIFTVSPIRHLKDTAHGNQLSKSTLLLAVDRLCTNHQNVYYFPSYEIVMDELRDYRFYAEDMVHVSSVGEEYIWEQFQNALFSSQTLKSYPRILRVMKGIAHRPLNPKSEEYAKFCQHLQSEMNAIEQEVQGIDFSEEKRRLTEY